MKTQSYLSFAALLPFASAHTIFSQLQVGSTTYPISYGIRTPNYDGPINDVSSKDVVCNGGPNPTTPSSKIIDVKAGDTVKAVWRHTLTSTPANDAIYVIDPSHKGPTIAYLKKVTDATTDSGVGDGWFKIQEQGYNPSTGSWGVTDLIANAGLHSITIPSCLANGQYLLRAELIALHSAGSSQGAQLYMECAQINVTGGSGTAAPSTVAFPGAYKSTDPGILINIYQTLPSYKIPGPPVFTCGSGSGPAPGTTSTPPAATPTTLATSTKVSTSAVSSSTAKPAALYAQCGGDKWAGATTCVSGTCKAQSLYYSQCVP
ncbi:Cellulose-binding protein [Glarea lozoyensis ATCC 20868]|uniref:AA9 family lytic polysaccharide monooxygenase n=1 Tax=Glarea lozoyensis (strain ATCC 20868 / MF5171) TaxID=1116229 RepID=S3DLL8_GLAL2|nr:Cellulose-binding protein [Glarea lozoyensis ATCC 20868]EPE27438.1 Cellulose-binding protein [Glarea lozoyensis ATCC 20868]